MIFIELNLVKRKFSVEKRNFNDCNNISHESIQMRQKRSTSLKIVLKRVKIFYFFLKKSAATFKVRSN